MVFCVYSLWRYLYHCNFANFHQENSMLSSWLIFCDKTLEHLSTLSCQCWICRVEYEQEVRQIIVRVRVTPAFQMTKSTVFAVFTINMYQVKCVLIWKVLSVLWPTVSTSWATTAHYNINQTAGTHFPWQQVPYLQRLSYTHNISYFNFYIKSI